VAARRRQRRRLRSRLFSDHTPMAGVGAVLHDGEVCRVVIPLVDQFDSADGEVAGLIGDGFG